MKSKKIAELGLLIALAFVLGYLESLIPFTIGIPGAKLGLANVVTLIAIVRLGLKDAVAVIFARAVLTGMTFGSLYSMIYSLAGGILSSIVMWALSRFKKFSMIGVSVAGGVFHNFGQLCVAMIILKSLDLKYYLGFLTVCGVVTGVFIGIICITVMKNIRTN
ncbi:MAG: Gx transporter family protein [Clostridium sp.]|nr:Gx transporter family protein [Clostridium sp.]